MKECPILFSGPMVRALLDGTKTQTRRMLKPRHLNGTGWHMPNEYALASALTAALSKSCPYGQPGGRLWVRETMRRISPGGWTYGADGAPVTLPRNHPSMGAMLSWAHHKEGDTCVSIHMPRWASRITLEVTDARVSRLCEISEEDARAEGVQAAPFCKAGRAAGMEHVEAFEGLWNAINGAGSWNANPWVWAISFRVLP